MVHHVDQVDWPYQVKTYIESPIHDMILLMYTRCIAPMSFIAPMGFIVCEEANTLLVYRKVATAVFVGIKMSRSFLALQACKSDGQPLFNIQSNQRILRVFKLLRILKILRLLKGVKVVE